MKKKDKTILLVEDNPDDAELVLLALGKLDIRSKVITAKDGKEACDKLFGPKAMRPDLVFLDLNLPKIGGLEVLKRIRNDERTKQLHVVIFTSSVEEEDVIKGYGLGVNNFVRKPIDYRDFATVIRTLGIYWLTEEAVGRKQEAGSSKQ